MKKTIEHALFNLSIFIAHEEYRTTEHIFPDYSIGLYHERTLYIFNIPVKTTSYITEA